MEQADLPGEVNCLTVQTGKCSQLCEGCKHLCDVPSDYAGTGTGCSIDETRNDGRHCPSGVPAVA